MTTKTIPNVEPPSGAAFVDDWQPGTPPYRVIFGQKRYVDDECNIWVNSAVTQFEDGSIGRIDDEIDAPRVHVETGWNGLTLSEALRLATALGDAALEIGRWIGPISRRLNS